MHIAAVDVGLVSSSDALVAFYQRVLSLQQLEPRVFPFATIHRLACGPVTLKVMVPTDPPAPASMPAPFWAAAGHRYLTLWVDDVEALAMSWAANGGGVTMAPTEIRPGVHTALLADPDGNVVEAMQEG
jgi:glyoxalase/bleomycin resistance protein/dioxygenase superfamily protein